MKGYIYKYTFPDGKVYIGQTRRDPQIRHREHISPVTGPTNGGFWEAYSTFKKCKFEIVEEYESNDIERLVGMLNYAETQLINTYKAYDPQYGYNKQTWGHSHTNYLTKEAKIIKAKINELYEAFINERMAIYNSVCDKIWETKLPLTEEEKDFVKTRCFNRDLFCFPDTFNIDKLDENDLDDEREGFVIEETLNLVKFDIEEETQTEFQAFLEENGSDIAGQILHEYEDANIIVAIDDKGHIAKEFHSFDEIISYFNVKRADNVKNVLAGRQKSAYGYGWKYKKDLK